MRTQLARGHISALMVALITVGLWRVAPAQDNAQLPAFDYSYLPPTPQHSQTSCIMQDSRGLIWIAYEVNANRIVVFDGHQSREILPSSRNLRGLPTGHIEALVEDPDGVIWMATIGSGLARYHPKTDDFTTIDVAAGSGLTRNVVRDIAFDGDGLLWMTCTGGLVAYDTAKLQFQTYLVDLPSLDSLEIRDANRMHVFVEDPREPDLIWIGSVGGLVSFDRRVRKFNYHRNPFNFARREPSAEQYLIKDLVFQNDSLLVMGTWSGGLMTFDRDNQQWEQYFDFRRTPEFNVFYDVEPFNEDLVWVNTQVGFGTFSLRKKTFAYYDSIPIPHVYPGGRYAHQMHVLNSRDLIVIGSSGGIVGNLRDVDPGQEQLFPPYVSSVSVEGEPIKPSNLLYTHRTLTAGNNQSEVSLRIVAPRYYQPDSVFYRYQLRGVDRNWRQQKGAVNATYVLDGGRYELQYQASLDGKQWIDGQSWQIEKFVPFWRATELKIVAVAVILLALFLYLMLTRRQRRKQAEMERAYQHMLAESEMSALRAQMNPHFIFNSLNSIKMHVMKQDTAVANHYLTRFSHLMRLVLRNSKSKLVTLEDELQALSIYIEIEKLRFDDGFDSMIIGVDQLDTEALYIPPMLVQPYVENAIWHGLMHKKSKGLLQLTLNLEHDHLHIFIEDNGVGRKQKDHTTQRSDGLKKSYGMQITKDRIALIRQSLGIEATVSIEDLFDDQGQPAGTRVHLKIPAIGPKQAAQWLDDSTKTN